MDLSRERKFTLGSETLHITTGLRDEGKLFVETVVSRGGRVVYRTVTDAEVLRPVSEHSQELLDRIDTQQELVIEKLERGLVNLDPAGVGQDEASTEMRDETHGSPETEEAEMPPRPEKANPSEPHQARTDAAKANEATPAGDATPAPIASFAPGTLPRRRAKIAESRDPSRILFIAGTAAVLLAVVLGGVFLFSGGNGSPGERLSEASRLLSAGQYQQAEEAYAQILSEHAELLPALVGRGRARLGTGDLEGGLVDLSRAVELAPQDPAMAEELADIFYSRDRFAEAAPYYEKALGVGSQSDEARFRLAVSLERLGRDDEALAQLQRISAAGPAHAEASLLYGSLLNRHGRYQEAESVFRKADKVASAQVDYYAELGVAVIEQGKGDEAEDVARNLLRQAPNDARAHGLLGEVHLARGQYEAARDELILALRINAEEPRAQIALGRTWLAIGRAQANDAAALAKAREILEGARGVPEGTRLQTLGQVSLAEGNPTAAIELFDRALEEGAKPLPTRLALVEAKMVAGDLEGVTEELQRAQEIAPTDASINLSLGLIYLRRGNQERATEEFLEAIRNAGVTAAHTSEAAEGSLTTVVMPSPHVPLPRGVDLNEAIRRAYRGVLAKNAEDPNAKALQEIARSMSLEL